MKPVKQTKMHDLENSTNGNCFAACLASILECAIDELPEFEEQGDSFLEAVFAWCKENDIEMVCAINRYPPLGYSVLVGRSPRSNCLQHAVIAFDGEPVFDPHPDGNYLAGAVTEWWTFKNMGGGS